MPSARSGKIVKFTCLLFALSIPFCMYVHSNISAIHAVVITQVILHSIAGHQVMPIVYIKLGNTNSDAHIPSLVLPCRPHDVIIIKLEAKSGSGLRETTPSWVSYRPRDLQTISIFVGNHSLSGVHMLHHSSNTDAWTHSW